MVATREAVSSEDREVIERLHRVFEAQRQAFARDGEPGLATRKDRISRAIAMIVAHADRFAEATHADYGARDPQLGKAIDTVGVVDGLKHDRRMVARFMRGERRSSAFPLGLLGGRSRVRYEPLGVIGNISPWNFPVQLSFSMLGAAFGAGNRVMIKPSDQTPETSRAIAEAVAEYFDETELAAFAGGVDLAVAFPKLPFDHLLFTGSPALAKIVAAEAAKNLTPVTLELGGKSPVIVGRGADLDAAAERILWGKVLNGGQVCLAPDYLFLPAGLEAGFVAAAKRIVGRMFPTMLDNDEYVSFVNARHYERVRDYLADARAKGATIRELNPAGEAFGPERRKLPVTLVSGVTDAMRIAHEEIFGPVLIVRTYDEIAEAIEYVNARPKPLALYYFGPDDGEWRRVLESTSSGGAAWNDVIVHIMQHDLPFGGVGNSGTGRYHAIEGFRRFSNPRGVYEQSKLGAKALRFALDFPLQPRHGKVLKAKLRK
ncbi:MAG: coniferyl aldehyde dehydrogenase [Woeseiaceae bacterium]|nr:coniferyl aldehyde dehydrogenase [Woeseiaceae bacterium]